jgi:hypothetical protein
MNLYMKNVFFVIIFLIIMFKCFSQENVNGNLNDEIIIGTKINHIYNPYKIYRLERFDAFKRTNACTQIRIGCVVASDSVARLLATVGYDFWTMTDIT